MGTAVFSAVSLKLCCWGPLLLTSIAGISGSSVYFSWLIALKPYLLVIAFLSLGLAFYQVYKKITPKEEQEDFEKIKRQIEDAISKDPELRELSKNLLVDMTTEGLRIQIVDQQGEPMFPSGSAKMFTKTQKLMSLVAKIVKNTPNDISIRGHTDGKPFRGNGGYSNWELSADRANASRRALIDNGVNPSKIANVVGKSDTDHINKDNPLDSKNRRISIVLIRESVSNNEGSVGGVNANNKTNKPTRNYQRSRGSVQFP